MNNFKTICPSGNIMLDSTRENQPSPHGQGSHSAEEHQGIMNRINNSIFEDEFINIR